MNVLAGHGRVEAATRVGLVEVPVVFLGHLDARTGREYRLADNRLAELSGWDRELLAADLTDIRADEAALEAIGFLDADLEKLLADPDVDAPSEFPDAGEGREPEYRCPRCSYEWRGGPK